MVCFTVSYLSLQAQLLGQDDVHDIEDIHETENSEFELTAMPTTLHITDDSGMTSDDDEMTFDDEFKKMLSDTITDSATLRKQINAVLRCVLKTVVKPQKDETGASPPRKTVLKRFLRR